MEPDPEASVNFRWRTERPNFGDSRRSPIFTIGDTRCLVEVYHSSRTYGMVFHVYNEPPSAFQVTVYIGGGDSFLFLGGLTVESRGYHPIPLNHPEGLGVLYQVGYVCFEFLISGRGKLEVQPVNEQQMLICIPDNSISLDRLSHDLRQLHDDSSGHDVRLRCEGQVLSAHRNILSARSEVFKAMLQADWRENQTGFVDIQDMGLPALRHFLAYVYTGTTPPDLTVDVAIELYKAGDKYAVGGLKEWCVEFLKVHFEDDNVGKILHLAETYSDHDLEESVRLYDARNDILFSVWD